MQDVFPPMHGPVVPLLRDMLSDPAVASDGPNYSESGMILAWSG